jgi:hypothetical protein
MRFYERAREQLGNEDRAMREALTHQIERLSLNEPPRANPSGEGHARGVI